MSIFSETGQTKESIANLTIAMQYFTDRLNQRKRFLKVGWKESFFKILTKKLL